MVITGMLVSPAAFAGQLNALGQWVPTSSAEGRTGWTAAGPTVESAGVAEASRSSSKAAGFVRPGREIRYRIDALGREVPIQTNHP
ncbi:MAG: hypothetical protein COV75_06235 [Candidatus Omnitrophica bacterium CG11_big_fil_rev_8_21_14_0_20_63_9]|nr:MAG: hypothetical protein COV75_06235 [Candidatus Omnitrophica bacterium CG11_big_fil_rev_8_21_14_0_20_63_9]